ncbi:MAG: SCO family protein [Bacillaceae bacterium]|nr:SCO family protein [Bacillaceae bacterium]
MKKKMWGLFLLLFILSACQAKEEINLDDVFNMKFQVRELEGINEQGATFNTSDLKGEVWLANFIFTNCDTVCPPMTANMARVQRHLKEVGLEDVRIVSFSIDPDHDTPDKLIEYGNLFDADFSKWDFITGYTQPEIEQFANISFLVPAAKIEGSNQFTHTTAMYLIDKDGFARESYSGIDLEVELIEEGIKKIKENS